MSRVVLLYFLPLIAAGEAASIHNMSECCLESEVEELESYLSELELESVPTVEMLTGGFKCPTDTLPFGALKTDWSRLLLLRDAQQEESILRKKLRRLYRILVVAYYRMEERFQAREIDAKPDGVTRENPTAESSCTSRTNYVGTNGIDPVTSTNVIEEVGNEDSAILTTSLETDVETETEKQISCSCRTTESTESNVPTKVSASMNNTVMDSDQAFGVSTSDNSESNTVFEAASITESTSSVNSSNPQINRDLSAKSRMSAFVTNSLKENITEYTTVSSILNEYWTKGTCHTATAENFGAAQLNSTVGFDTSFKWTKSDTGTNEIDRTHVHSVTSTAENTMKFLKNETSGNKTNLSYANVTSQPNEINDRVTSDYFNDTNSVKLFGDKQMSEESDRSILTDEVSAENNSINYESPTEISADRFGSSRNFTSAEDTITPSEDFVENTTAVDDATATQELYNYSEGTEFFKDFVSPVNESTSESTSESTKSESTSSNSARTSFTDDEKLQIFKGVSDGKEYWKYDTVSQKYFSNVVTASSGALAKTTKKARNFAKSRKRGSLNTDIEKSFRWFYSLGNKQAFTKIAKGNTRKVGAWKIDCRN